MSENEFLNALKEEMPEGFGRELLAQLKAEDKKKKVMPFPTFWTVAVASIVTVLVGFVLFFSRMSITAPLSLAMQAWQSRERLTPENINLIEPLLTIGEGQGEAIAISPDGNTLAVGTSKGVYLHNAHDLAAEPVALGLPPHVYFNTGYNTRFRYMEYIPDGRLFMLVNRPNALTLYQWSEAEGYLELYTSAQPWLTAQAVDVSPDGTMLLLGTCSSQYSINGDFCNQDGLARLEIIDIATGDNVFFRMPLRISNAIAAVNPDWTLMAYQEDNQIKLYDLISEETSVLLNVEEVLISNEMAWNEMHRLYFSPDGTKLGVIEGNASPMDWWELSALQAEPQTVPPFGDDLSDYMTVSPATALYPLSDEYALATNFGILAYEYFGGNPIATFASEYLPISLKISADGQALYTLDMSGVIRRWDWQSQSLSEVNTRYTTGSTWGLSISADSRLFASGGYGSSGLGYLYELSPSGVRQSYLGYNEFTDPNSSDTVISQDGRYVAFTENGELWVHDRNEQSRSRVSSAIGMYWLSFRPDGALMAFVIEGDYGKVQVYTAEMLETGAFPTNNVIEPIESVPLTGIRFSPDGSKMLVLRCSNHDLYTSCENPDLRLFDTLTWEEIATLDTGITSDEIFANYTFSADSQWLFLSYCDMIDARYGWPTCIDEIYTLEVWRTADIATNPAPMMRVDGLGYEFAQIMNILSYPDGSFLFASYSWSYYDETQNDFLPNAIFWELEPDGSFREIRRMEMRFVTFAPDGSYFLTGRDGQIELWGVPGGVASGN